MPNKIINKVVIWDLPTRVFHWLLLASYLLAWITYADNRFLYFHVFVGYIFFGLLIFRLAWGFIGTHYAQFRSFAQDWSSVTEYLKGLINGKAMRYIGHNPIGGYAIFAMLLLGFIISISGLLTLAGEEGHGPLQGMVNYSVGIASHSIHEILAWVMLLLTIVHVLGVIVESIWHKENLVWAMLSGQKEAAAGTSSIQGHHLLALSISMVVIIVTPIYFNGYLKETADKLYQPYKGPVLPDNASWRENCSECHIAFHPSLLPARSWQKIFNTQHQHFEDDLDLDDETITELLKFHLDNAAEKELTEAARKILYYTPENVTPIRITKTIYWEKKHKDIDEAYWKHDKIKIKGNCDACHLDAKEGTYEDSDMRLPELE